MAYLIIKNGQRGDLKVPLGETPIFIGRSPDKDVCLRDLTVSNSHAKLVWEGGAYRLVDLRSTNGTFVNGEQIDERVLSHQDEITIGTTTIVFSEERETPPTPETLPRYRAPSEPRVDELFASTVAISIDDIESDVIEPVSKTRALPADTAAMHHKIRVLYNLGQTVNRLERLDQFLPRLVKLVEEAVGGERIFVMLIDPATGDLVPRAYGGRAGARGEKQGVSSTILNRVLTEREALMTRDALADARFREGESVALMRLRGVMCVPLGVKQAVYGAIYVDTLTRPSTFTEDDLRLLGVIGNQASIILRNIQLYEDARRTNQELLKAREEILAWNRELERKVEERTAELKKQSEEIKALAEIKDELLGIAAHDLRTPLTIIHGYAQLLLMALQDEAQPRARLAEDLRTIERTSLEMTNLLTDLLDVSKIEAGKIRISPEEVDAEELVLNACGLHQVLASGKKLTINLNIEKGLPRIVVDPKRIGQVLNNLLSNAIKFSDEGSTVTLSVRRVQADGLATPEAIEFGVEDTGQGIAAEDLPKLFSKFQQSSAKPTRGEKGTGLGLAIAKKLVELHNGRIGVESVQGRGSRFFFVIPLVPPTAAAASATAQPAQVALRSAPPT